MCLMLPARVWPLWKSCCEIKQLAFGKSRHSHLRGAVVHSDPPLLHKLSTDLSFVDNFGRGVQSRSKHHTDCVAQRKPGWSHGNGAG